jgi:RNA polymerase sigma-70 factor, ECF subfamily
MDNPSDMQGRGPFDARYRAFLETITQLRPRLHRYCSRMTGTVMDGEDVVQDALFEAYRKLDQYDDSRPLAPWLFRIAHNRCIDFLRRRGARVDAETASMSPDYVMPANPAVFGVGRAVEQLVMNLPPKERACVRPAFCLASPIVRGIPVFLATRLSRMQPELVRQSRDRPQAESNSAQ